MNSVLRKINLKKSFPYLGLIVEVIVFAILTQGASLSLDNIAILFKQSYIQCIVCIGAAFVIAHGNNDFSLAGVVCLAACLGGVCGKINPALTIVVCMVTSIVLELVLAFVHIALKVPAFIASWAMMFLSQGFTYQISANGAAPCPPSLLWMKNTGFCLGLLVVIFIIAFVLMEYTKIGKFNRAIGANATAAGISGINVGKQKYIAYLISGVCCGLGALLSLTRSGMADQSTASGLAINVLVACVLGGAPLVGGTQLKLHSGIVGTFVLMVLANGLTILKVNSEWLGLAKGLILLGAVVFTYDRGNQAYIR